jgi:hypothetical protein
MYDFHARQYDAALGRWFGTDPKAGVMAYNSPYVAMMNNPVSFHLNDLSTIALMVQSTPFNRNIEELKSCKIKKKPCQV